jgi:hypothetical protein
MTRNGIATVEKMVLSVTQPMAKKAMPSISAMVVRLRLFIFITGAFSFVYLTGFTSVYGLGFSNKVAALPFNVNSKNDKR